ncbi:MAG: hypothetical protein ACLVL2_25715 [Bacteroides cellulosilyticus]
MKRECRKTSSIVFCISVVSPPLHEGMRWPDIKRYGILIYRRDMANQRVTDLEMPPNDLRYDQFHE